MLKVASILLCLAFTTIVWSQDGDVRLLDSFERISCPDFRYRIDSFMSQIASNQDGFGYVALSGDSNYLDAFRRRKMIEEQLSLRNFPKKRVTFLRRTGLGPLEAELWVGRPGAKNAI